MDASITHEALRIALSGSTPPLVIDVRRNERFHEAKDLICGARRGDPQRVAEWSKTLPAAARIVVYCVHGHEVSQGVAKALATAGFEARYLEGGIELWRDAGGELSAKAQDDKGGVGTWNPDQRR